MTRRELLEIGFSAPILAALKDLIFPKAKKLSINPTSPIDTSIPDHLGYGRVLFFKTRSDSPWKMLNKHLATDYWQGAYSLTTVGSRVCGKIYITPERDKWWSHEKEILEKEIIKNEESYFIGHGWINVEQRPILANGICEKYISQILIQSNSAEFIIGPIPNSTTMSIIPDSWHFGRIAI